MKRIPLASPLIALVSIRAFAEIPAPTMSPVISKGECSVAYSIPDGKSSNFKVVKKSHLSKFAQKIPKGSSSEVCSKEIKDELKITAQVCEVFCNPN